MFKDKERNFIDNRKYIHRITVIVLLITILFSSFNILSDNKYSILSGISSMLISVTLFWFLSKVMIKKYGQAAQSLLLISFIVICIKIFDGAFLNEFYRFFVDCIVFLLGGIYLINNKKLSIAFVDMVFLLFAAPLIMFIPVFLTTTPNFAVLILTLPISLLFIWLYSISNQKVFILIIEVIAISLLSFVAYPNFWHYQLSDKIIETGQMDVRATLPLIQQNADTTSLTEIGNKIVILDVWYSGCGVCFKKFPEFEALAREYAKDTNLYFAALNIPLKKELDTLGSFGLVEEYSFNKLQATSTTDENKWGIEMGYPTLLVFDQNHKIRYSGTLNTNRLLLVNNIHKIIDELKKE